MSEPVLYELRITATGTVRDKDGNVIDQQPIEAVQTVTEDEMKRIIQANEETTE